MSLRIAGLAMAISLGGCGDEPGRGGLTAEEERQLDNAAAMLEDNVFDTSADSMVANETALDETDAAANDSEGADGNAQ